MSDLEARELVRAAETSWEPEAWLRAARAFVRSSQWDEAGHAFARARAVGGATDEDLDSLAPTLESFAVVSVHTLALPDRRLDAIAWSRDGRRLFATGRNLTEIDVASGAKSLVAESVHGPLAVGERHVAFGRVFDAASYWRVTRRDLATGAEVEVPANESHLRSIALSGRDDERITYATGSVLASHVVGSPPRSKVRITKRLDQSVSACGRVLLLDHNHGNRRLCFRDPAAPPSTATFVALRSLGLELATRTWAIGRRALVTSDHARTMLLASEDGRTLGRTEWPHARGAWPSAMTPSGRLLVCTYPHGIRTITLFDLIGGADRTIDLASVLSGESVNAVAWSPSGRKLAVANARELVVLGA